MMQFYTIRRSNQKRFDSLIILPFQGEISEHVFCPVTTVQLTITLPDNIAQSATVRGLLQPDSVAALLNGSYPGNKA